MNAEVSGTVECASSGTTDALDVRVSLEDTTMLDAPAVVVARTRCRLGPDPTARASFTLSVADEALDARRAYTLSASADVPGRGAGLRFGTVQSYPWSIGTSRPSRLVLRRLDRG